MQPSWTAPFSLPLLQRLSCLEGILSCPCRFLYPADSIGSLQGGFLRRLLRCPSFHLLLHPGCQALELATRSFCSGWMLIFTDGGAVLIVRRCMVFGSNCFRGFSLIRMLSGCFWRMAFCLAVSSALLFWFCLLMESDPPSDISCPFWILGVSLAARIFCSFVLTASEIAFCRLTF